jgi:hypothetical protein
MKLGFLGGAPCQETSDPILIAGECRQPDLGIAPVATLLQSRRRCGLMKAGGELGNYQIGLFLAE